VYLAVLGLLRMAGKRELGQMSLADLVVILVIANAVQNALNGADPSLTGGLVSAATLVGMSYLLDRFGRRVPFLGRLVVGEPTLLLQDGRLIEENLRREHLQPADLEMASREHGVADLSDVAAAMHRSRRRPVRRAKGRGRQPRPYTPGDLSTPARRRTAVARPRRQCDHRVMSQKADETTIARPKQRPSTHDRLCMEHVSIGRDLGTLVTVADALKTASPESLRAEIDEAHRLVADRIIPHLETELALVNHLAARDHRPIGVDPITRDIEKLNLRLDLLTSHVKAGPNGSAQSIRAVLYDIRALAHSHFAPDD